jgi:dihydroflavonol-4-reductase
VEIITGDLRDSQSLDSFFAVSEGMEPVVIHCASMVTVNPDYDQKLMDMNVVGTKSIIDKCLQRRECRKLVCLKSIHILNL